ncbi:hypothetical protein IMG5_147030 [Ichthyophthirius multifiliis]|uniref:Transmembrane protein n=1 Tax=Ichthyophthirius multifiliis TaxID=5932 RepID=G0QY34_ICHMU|nr:hypothetical protein IMG5_147030 [Ichthyophthirius multifiliis]EGR29860.1 hypothetical protein IMG5_147030 [Ichthyophthirius multifiliis]|eukprot:XP_004031096.1 hypothetical protein IMG5_147030 [Ichthyophthirius multifiliis]
MIPPKLEKFIQKQERFEIEQLNNNENIKLYIKQYFFLFLFFQKKQQKNQFFIKQVLNLKRLFFKHKKKKQDIQKNTQKKQKLKCAKIGLQQTGVNLETNALLLMEKKSYKIKIICIKITKQSLVKSIFLTVFVHMVIDVNTFILFQNLFNKKIMHSQKKYILTNLYF